MLYAIFQINLVPLDIELKRVWLAVRTQQSFLSVSLFMGIFTMEFAKIFVSGKSLYYNCYRDS